MQNSNKSILDQIKYAENKVTKYEKKSKFFSILCPILGVIGVCLNIAGLCFFPVLTKAIKYTYLFCGLLAGGVASLVGCIVSDLKHKKLENKYEEAKSEVHSLKNKLYEINANTKKYESDKKATNVVTFTQQQSYLQQKQSSKSNDGRSI